MQLSITSDLHSIEIEWRRFERSAECTPFQTFDWLSAWQDCIGRPAGVKPAIITGRNDNGDVLFILPLAIEQSRFDRRCVFLGHALCDYNGPLLAPAFPGTIAPTGFSDWWRAIAAFMQKTEGYEHEVVSFDKMPERIGEQLNPLLALRTQLNGDCAYRTRLGEDWDSFYSAKRSSTERRRRRWRRRQLADNGELQVIAPGDPGERGSTLGILFDQKGRQLARKSEAGLPGRRLDNLFRQPEFAKFYHSIAAKPDSFVHISRLDVGSICVAANLGLRFRDTYYYVLTSYDDGPLGKFGPGVVHLHELMRYAISQKCKYFDFTIGDHPYKLEWADEQIKLYDHIAAARWLGLAAVTQTRAKRLVKKTPLLGRLAHRGKSLVVSMRRRLSA